MLALLGVALSAPYTKHDGSCRVLGGEPEDFKRYHHVSSGDECLAHCNANAACTAYEYANVLQNNKMRHRCWTFTRVINDFNGNNEQPSHCYTTVSYTHLTLPTKA